jgi:hypothetical protein
MKGYVVHKRADCKKDGKHLNDDGTLSGFTNETWLGCEYQKLVRARHNEPRPSSPSSSPS